MNDVHTRTHTHSTSKHKLWRATNKIKNATNLFLHIAQQFLARLGLCHGKKHDEYADQIAVSEINDDGLTTGKTIIAAAAVPPIAPGAGCSSGWHARLFGDGVGSDADSAG